MFLPGAPEWLADLNERFSLQRKKADAEASAASFEMSSQASSSSSVQARRKSKAKPTRSKLNPVGSSKRPDKQGPNFNEKMLRAWAYGAVEHLPLQERGEIVRLLDTVTVRNTNRAAYMLGDAYKSHRWELKGEQEAREYPFSEEGSESSMNTMVSTIGPRPKVAPSASISRASEEVERGSGLDPNPDVRRKSTPKPVATQQPAVLFTNVTVTPRSGNHLW